jgi:hypothetical protein
VVAAHKGLAPRQALEDVLDIVLLVQDDITKVDYEVFGLDGGLPIGENAFRKISRAITIRRNIGVIKDACQL